MQNRRAPFVFLIVALLASSLGAAGCLSTGGPTASPQTGTLQIALEAGGASIATVSYAISGPSSFTQTGTINVSHSATISAVLGPFPAGGGYTLALSALSTDGSESCAGGGTFNILAGQTAEVSVPLTCHQAPRTGSVSVNGTLNLCPQIDSLDASPAEVLVGGSVGLIATAHDTDNAPSPVSATWTRRRPWSRRRSTPSRLAAVRGGASLGGGRRRHRRAHPGPDRPSGLRGPLRAGLGALRRRRARPAPRRAGRLHRF